MCGIAGYNASTAWAMKHLTPAKMELLLQEAWLHNLHRGNDAAGFFAEDVDGNFTRYKAPGSPFDLLMNEVLGRLLIEPARVFAAHTRATTQGQTQDNRNNHPVEYKNVHVTHNGTIQNDTWRIKHAIGDDGWKTTPTVDTVVFPIILRELTDGPFDYLNIADQLDSLYGSFAIHAYWEEFKGTSLLARNTGKPLCIAWDEDVIFYGSEPESIAGMIKAIDLNPDDYLYEDIQGEQMVIIADGEPIFWGDWASPGLARKQAPFTVTRFLPPEKKKQKPIEVYSTSNSSHFHVAAREDNVHSLFSGGDGEIIYTREDGFADSKKFEMPGSSEFDALLSFVEADLIIRDSADYYHCFYGDIEIIVSKHNSIRDVYNHDLFDMGQRLEVVESTPPDVTHIKGSTLAWQTWVTQNTKLNKPDEDMRYGYVILEEAEKNDPKVMGSENFAASTIGSELDLNGCVYRPPEFTITYQEALAGDGVTWHEDFTDMYFHKDTKCPQHDVLLSKHKNPHDCKVVLNMAAYAMSACDSIWSYVELDPGLQIVETYPFGKASEDVCDKHMHRVANNEYVLVKWKDMYYSIKTGMVCDACGMEFRLQFLPNFMYFLEHSKRERVELITNAN